MILSGEVALTSPASPVPASGARPGDIIGSLQTLSGHAARPGGRASAEPGVALRIAREDLFDVLGERPELLRQIFAAMFRRVAGPAFASGVFRPKAHAVGGLTGAGATRTLGAADFDGEQLDPDSTVDFRLRRLPTV